MGSLAFEMFLFAMFGLGLETAFTALLDWRRTRDSHLMGYSSVWYIPLYTAAPLILHLGGDGLMRLPLVVRGLAYMLLIYIFEYAGMLALRKALGSSPSEASYFKSRWNVHGLIRLDFAPAWFLAGLLFEYTDRFLHRSPWSLDFLGR